MDASKRVRLSDIAERLDLSTVSISKALRGHPDIADATRERVQETAKEMGYVPNLVARSLSSKQSKTLGIVLPKIAHSFFASVLDGIHERAAEEGYEIVLTVSREQGEEERRHIETLLAMRVDGLLVSSAETPPDPGIYERVREMRVPLVFFDRVPDGLAFSTVTASDREGARRAVVHLLEQGYEKVAHLAGYDHLNIGRERRLGYEDALAAFERSPRDGWIVEGGMNEKDGYRGLEQLMATREAPEAIFTVTFPVGLGALDALHDAYPEHANAMQIVAFGKHNFNRHLRQPFLCVQQPNRAMGRRATELLLEEVHADGSPPEPQHVVLPTRLDSDERWTAAPEKGEPSASAGAEGLAP